MYKNIGFVSARFAGTDGVTLESSKWAEVFEKNGHRCFWFAGELDREPEKSYLVPEAHFHHAQNKWIAENALTIPMHVPLGLALTETIVETKIPTIAHHHDFYWERIRFSVNAVSDYIRKTSTLLSKIRPGCHTGR